MKIKTVAAILASILIAQNLFADVAGSNAEAAEGNNKFAVELYKKLNEKDKKANKFFSPYSIYTAFSMLYEGAAGKTAEEFERIFGFPADEKRRQMFMRSSLSNKQSLSRNFGIYLANSLWIDEKDPVKEEYSKILKTYYFADIEAVNFSKSETTDKINKWVSDKTAGKIFPLFKTINSDTALILINTIYFKAGWEKKFPKSSTFKQPFYVTGQEFVDIDMMRQNSNFLYSENAAVQVLKMFYEKKAPDMSMIIVLPKENNIGEAEKYIYNNSIKKINSSLVNDTVMVIMPKFEQKFEYDLLRIIEQMGLSNTNVNYSKISPNEIFLSRVLHNTYIKVDEEKTEAAAATAIEMKNAAAPVKRTVFKADHPFVYMIIDEKSGEILFMGKMMNPGK